MKKYDLKVKPHPFSNIKEEFFNNNYNQAIQTPGFPNELKNERFLPEFFYFFVRMKTFIPDRDFLKINKNYFSVYKKD